MPRNGNEIAPRKSGAFCFSPREARAEKIIKNMFDLEF